MLNSGDTAFMAMCTALVMLMTPGLAIFYGGLVRAKNTLSTILQSMICLGIVSILWVIFGYTLSFGPDIHGIIGSLDFLGLKGVGLDPGPYVSTIPDLLFCSFQLMFAIITPALITGAFAERIKFSGFVLFTILWTTLIYFPLCHWVWGGGWIAKLGALDFAGGTVIHINSGAAALMAALLIGPRKNYKKEPFQPHNLPLTILGAGILWFGWFGFNAGSALGANKIAILALFNTQIATGAALVSWIMAEWITIKKPTTLGAASGALAGLVAITPAAGFVGPISALIIGLCAGPICYLAVLFKEKKSYDDALDVVGIHGIGGIWGALATGLFASLSANPDGANGLFFGNPKQFFIQCLATVSAIVFSALGSFVILKLIKCTVGLRVEEEDEVMGLDISQHKESAYNI